MVEHGDSSATRQRVGPIRRRRDRVSATAPPVEAPHSEHSEHSDTNIESADSDEDSSSTHAHLREISPLASWTVSTYKPGCGIPALLAPSTTSFWQSDGPQPHLLNIHFFKLVHIVKFRVYLDHELDESYTPTKMVFAAGMGEYDLVEFAEWKGEQPRGWVEVGLGGCAGEREGWGGAAEEGEEGGGGVLRCMVVQVRVLENHQNGKDTHIRGVQIFARDERVRASGGVRRGQREVGEKGEGGGGGMMLGEQLWMDEEVEIR